MTWRVDAEGRPPQTRPSEAAALKLQAELMAKGARYVVVWWQGLPGVRKAPQTHVTGSLSASGLVQALLSGRPSETLTEAKTKGTA